jgi:hypothetical protein
MRGAEAGERRRLAQRQQVVAQGGLNAGLAEGEYAADGPFHGPTYVDQTKVTVVGGWWRRLIGTARAQGRLHRCRLDRALSAQSSCANRLDLAGPLPSGAPNEGAATSPAWTGFRRTQLVRSHPNPADPCRRHCFGRRNRAALQSSLSPARPPIFRADGELHYGAASLGHGGREIRLASKDSSIEHPHQPEWMVARDLRSIGTHTRAPETARPAPACPRRDRPLQAGGASYESTGGRRRPRHARSPGPTDAVLADLTSCRG